MKKFPLLLERYFVKESYFALSAGFDLDPMIKTPETLPHHPKLELRLEKGPNETQPRLWRVELEVRLDNSDHQFPYEFRVILVGIFRVPDVVPEDQIDPLVSINAPSVLFSAMREYIANLTGRSYYHPVLLPLVTFSSAPFFKSTNVEPSREIETETSLSQPTKSRTKKRLKSKEE